jgi:hypothetical protein
MTASPRIDLGGGLGDAAFARDGRSLFVLSPGSGGIPGALYRIDLAVAAVSKRLPLDRVVDQFAVVGDDTGIVLQKGGLLRLPRRARGDGHGRSGRQGLGTDRHPGLRLSVRHRDERRVISVAERKLVNQATRSLFILGTNGQKNAMLYVLRGNARGVTAVSPAPELASGPTATLFSGFVANSMKAIDAVATPDGRRVFLLMRQYDKCCTLGVADPEAARKVATLQVGKTSRRVAQALFSLAATAASYASARADARADGRNSFECSVYSLAAAGAPRGAFAFGPDAKTIYVLDSGTDVVTVTAPIAAAC